MNKVHPKCWLTKASFFILSLSTALTKKEQSYNGRAREGMAVVGKALAALFEVVHHISLLLLSTCVPPPPTPSPHIPSTLTLTSCVKFPLVVVVQT